MFPRIRIKIQSRCPPIEFEALNSGEHEEHHLTGFCAVKCGIRLPRFGRLHCFHLHGRTLFLTGCSFGVFFDPEAGGSTFLRDSCKPLPDYTALRLRRQYSACTYLVLTAEATLHWYLCSAYLRRSNVVTRRKSPLCMRRI
jgi:hypothetical protein